jgi:deoxyribodipyrimidine photo-lyase
LNHRLGKHATQVRRRRAGRINALRCHQMTLWFSENMATPTRRTQAVRTIGWTTGGIGERPPLDVLVRTIVWFRGKDLRITDHTPLLDAISAGEVVPVFVLDEFFFAAARAQQTPHRVQFLLASLRALKANIQRKGSELLVVPGRSVEVVPRLADTLAADRVLAYRWTEPFARERDRRISAALGSRFCLYDGETLAPPGTLRTKGGGPYGVFTPFARAFRERVLVEPPGRAPRSIPPLPDLGAQHPETCPVPTCEDLGIAPNASLIEPGERAARGRVASFLGDGIIGYATRRDRLDDHGTSRLSQDLKFGLVSVADVWTRVSAGHGGSEDGTKYLTELLWREFAYQTLWDRPELLDEPFRRKFCGFPWRHDEPSFHAWRQGQTGYPIVDAAARQLLREGFVHGRARMIAASFLCKHLLVDYKLGEAHYLRHLTDGDWAQNNMGWQWSAGCGCDAQPYFRVFNPMTQGKRYDPEGSYVRRYVPELAKMPARHIHEPWRAPTEVLEEAGVTIGETYPLPIGEHIPARKRFLEIAKGHLSS